MSKSRVILKLSGEAFADPELGYGIDPTTVDRVAQEIAAVHDQGHEIAIVVGGGNIFRGLSAAAADMDRANADYMGMLASVINAMALQDSLEKVGLATRVLSALEIKQVAEGYIRRRAIRHLERGRVVIFGGGTGNPYFTTDTAAALRAAEVQADVILKATQVDGVYDRDPNKHSDAVRFEKITYERAIREDLRFMDQTAIALCRENSLPIVVFDMGVSGNIHKVVVGETVGTIVSD